MNVNTKILSDIIEIAIADGHGYLDQSGQSDTQSSVELYRQWAKESFEKASGMIFAADCVNGNEELNAIHAYSMDKLFIRWNAYNG